MTWWIACVSVRTVWISLVLIRCTRPDLPHPLPIQPNSSLPFYPEHNLCVRKCVFVWVLGTSFMCLDLSESGWGVHSSVSVVGTLYVVFQWLCVHVAACKINTHVCRHVCAYITYWNRAAQYNSRLNWVPAAAYHLSFVIHHMKRHPSSSYWWCLW